MFWFLLWATLILATLIGAFFLGRNLWRRAKALLAEVERAAATLEQLQNRVEELTETLEQAAAAAAAQRHELTDLAAARERVAEQKKRRATRRAERAASHDHTYSRWRVISDHAATSRDFLPPRD